MRSCSRWPATRVQVNSCTISKALLARVRDTIVPKVSIPNLFSVFIESIRLVFIFDPCNCLKHD